MSSHSLSRYLLAIFLASTGVASMSSCEARREQPSERRGAQMQQRAEEIPSHATQPGQAPSPTGGGPSGTIAPTGGGPSAMNQAAIEQIAQARCAREQRCNNIGPGRRHADNDSCMNAVRSSTADELNTQVCPGGINTKELGECIQEIRNQDCANPLDALGRLAACRSSELCLH